MFQRRVSMPAALSEEPELHLLEELAAPLANINASRIAVWVYRDDDFIREIVLSGHAEPGTCGMVTSRLLQVVAELHGTPAEVRLTAGAAHLLIPPQADFIVIKRGDKELFVQGALAQLVNELGGLAEQIGLVQIFERRWAALLEMRQSFSALRGTAAVVPPETIPMEHAADFIPIIPDRGDGEPFSVTLEGWHYDCPEFQAVAERHLRKVQRDLLRDAMTRRRIFQSWLREWVMAWIRLLHELPQAEAEGEEGREAVKVELPGKENEPKSCDAREFLREHLASFVGDESFAYYAQQTYARLAFGQTPEEDLDKEVNPKKVEQVVFSTAHRFDRPSSDKDKPVSIRHRATQNMPGLLTTCLQHIHQMDDVIRPYEDLGKTRLQPRSPSADKEKDSRYVIDDISRRVLIDTMIRGWPSFYLDDRHDKEAFKRWAGRCREGVWRVLGRQAAKAKVAVELLMERNVFFDVRFTNELSCRITPLMLIDQKAHVQLHGSRAGASCSIPLWPRRRVMPLALSAEGLSHREHARRLVEAAARELERPEGSIWEASDRLREALVVHPPEAGSAILREWLRRLGPYSDDDITRASAILQAVEAFERGWHVEAAAFARAYLATEREPIAEGWAIAGISQMIADSQHAQRSREIRETIDKLEITLEELSEEGGDHVAERRKEAERRYTKLRDELHRIADTMPATAEMCSMLERALKNPDHMRIQHQALAMAVERVPDLVQVIARNGLRLPISDELRERYGPSSRTAEVLALLKMLFSLAVMEYRVGEDAEEARKNLGREVRAMLFAPWLPPSAEAEIQELRKDFSRTRWDRIYSHRVQHVVRAIKAACLGRLDELFADRMRGGIPPLQERVLNVYFALSIQRLFAGGLAQLINLEIPLARAFRGQWTLRDEELARLPDGARIAFDPVRRVLEVQLEDETHIDLLELDAAEDEELEHLIELTDDPAFLARASDTGEKKLARALLAANILPVRKWLRWRAAMEEVSDELLIVLAHFPLIVSLFPQLNPPLPEEAQQALDRLDKVTPRAMPRMESEIEDLAFARPGRRKRSLRPAASVSPE